MLPIKLLNDTAFHSHKRSAVADRIFRTAHCKKTVLILELFLCLSRACLGKMIIFSIKWRQKRRVFLPASPALSNVPDKDGVPATPNPAAPAPALPRHSAAVSYLAMPVSLLAVAAACWPRSRPIVLAAASACSASRRSSSRVKLERRCL